MYPKMHVWKYVDVDQEYVEVENMNISYYLLLSLEHVRVIDENTNENLIDIVVE